MNSKQNLIQMYQYLLRFKSRVKELERSKGVTFAECSAKTYSSEYTGTSKSPSIKLAKSPLNEVTLSTYNSFC